MPNYEILTPLIVEAGKPPKTGTITMDEEDASRLIAVRAIRLIPEVEPQTQASEKSEGIPEVSARMTVAALTAIATEEAVTLPEGASKAQIVEAILAARAAPAGK